MQGISDKFVEGVKQVFTVLYCVCGVAIFITVFTAFSLGLYRLSDDTSIDPSVARQKRIEDKVDLVIVKLDQLNESK